MAKPKNIGRTMKAAHQLSLAGEGELAMAVELIDVHTPKNQELSLTARRCLLLMLEAAAGDAWRAQSHTITKKDLRGSHKAMDRVRPAFEELMGVWFSHADNLGGKPSRRMFHLLETINDQNDDANSALVEFAFTPRARALLAESDVYARLSREAIVRFQSRYSLRLYEIGAALYGRRAPTWTGDVDELRKLLHVPPGTYPNFTDFRKRILDPAKREINQLAEFNFDWREHRKSRKVERVTMTFEPKERRAAMEAAEERERHSTGRRARRDGTVERMLASASTSLKAPPALQWPADDTLADWLDSTRVLYDIGRQEGGGHSIDRLSHAYVQQLGEKRFQLTGERLEASWRGFCQQKARDWRAV